MKKDKKADPQFAEANKYDKILKENLRKAIPAMLRHILNLSVAKIQPLNVELQHTDERKADFIGFITDSEALRSVMHLEFQVHNDSKMPQRMLEYRTMLRRKYPGMRIVQYVIFLGKKAPTMKLEVNEPDLIYRYQLNWIQRISYQKFLHSERPEEVLLAVLADFGKTAPEKVADEVVWRIRAKAASELEFQRFTEQLRVLSNIRNLQPLIELIMEKVSRFFVESRDPLYRKGKLEGKLEGKRESEAESAKKELARTKEIVKVLLAEGSFSAEKIALLMKVTLEFVAEVKKEMEEEARANSN